MTPVNDKDIQFLMKNCSVSYGVAMIALMNSRGSISIAKELLESDACKKIYYRQAREFNL